MTEDDTQDLIELLDNKIEEDTEEINSVDRQPSGAHQITSEQTSRATPEIINHDPSKLD